MTLNALVLLMKVLDLAVKIISLPDAGEELVVLIPGDRILTN